MPADMAASGPQRAYFKGMAHISSLRVSVLFWGEVGLGVLGCRAFGLMGFGDFWLVFKDFGGLGSQVALSQLQ